jgi:ABC-type bacteriocin/lantibiotic exporter with double-glycine peptidase domain
VLTYAVLGSFPFYIGISTLVTPLFRHRLEEKFERGAENQAFLVESVTGVETRTSHSCTISASRGFAAGYPGGPIV